MFDLVDKMIIRNLRIIYKDKELFFKIDDDIYKIVFSKDLINTKIYRNKEKIPHVDYTHQIELYSFLYAFDKKKMSKILKIPEKDYLNKSENILNKSLQDFIFEKYKTTTKRKFFSYTSFLPYKYAKYHDIEENNNKKNHKEIEKTTCTKEIIDVNIFKEILKEVIISKDITLFKNQLFFNLNSSKNIIYNFNNHFQIIFNNNSYELTYDYLKYILGIVKFKDTTNKEFNQFLKNNNIGKCKLDIEVFDKSLSIYDLNLFKTKIKIKKQGNINLFEKGIQDKPILKKKNNSNFLFNNEKFGTIGEALGVTKIGIKDEFVETNNFQPYFKNKIEIKKEDKIIENINSLVLWDIENINYYNDFSMISRYVKDENQLRIIAFNEKFRIFNKKRIDFLLNKLKKRKWIIKETKKIADNELINEFNKYKNKINELIIISNDSDFKNIILEANQLKIKTTILYRNNNKKQNKWYLEANEQIDLSSI